MAPQSGARTGSRLPVPDSLRATVTYVYDGDTLRVRLESGENARVRLIGIDAPEYDDPKEEVRLMAFLAKRFAAARLNRCAVRLTFDRERTDSYGRVLAYVWTEDGSMFNETALAGGFAAAYLKYPFDEGYRERFKELEAAAREAGAGMWHRGPRAETPAAAVGDSAGRVVSVRITCLRAFDRSSFRVLVPGEGRFEVLIPRSVLAALPGSLEFEGRSFRVTGLVEEYEGRPQIMVGVPLQLQAAD